MSLWVDTKPQHSSIVCFQSVCSTETHMRLCEANCGQSRSFVQGKMAAQMVQFGPKVIPCGTAQMEAFGTPFFSWSYKQESRDLQPVGSTECTGETTHRCFVSHCSEKSGVKEAGAPSRVFGKVALTFSSCLGTSW